MQGTMGFKPLLRYNLQSVEFKMEIDKKKYLNCFMYQGPFDWTTMVGKRDAYVKKLNGIYQVFLQQNFSKEGEPKQI